LKAKKPVSPAYPLELKTIGDHIRKRRLDLGLYQKDIAKKFGADLTSVFNWENNVKSPAIRFIPHIIQFLGYNPFEDISSAGFGKRIVAYRKMRGLTQKEFAHQLGIDPTTMSRWEKGKSTFLKKGADTLNSLLLSAETSTA
jgi:transcriptional regulator with XRE-family HTH domain